MEAAWQESGDVCHHTDERRRIERSHATDGWGVTRSDGIRINIPHVLRIRGYMGGVHGGANHGEVLGNMA